MTRQEIDRLKSNTDLREIAEEFTELKGMGEKYGACPLCGGKDRFHVSATMFFCRECKPLAKGRNDIFDFLVWVGKCRDFREALNYLTNGATKPHLFPVRKIENSKPKIEPEEWQKTALERARKAHESLLGVDGSKGRDYLTKRGITQETWTRARLGLHKAKDSAGNLLDAISIPWFLDGKVIAIQNRIIDPKAEKYTRFGSGGYYGEASIYIPPKQERHDKFLVVEGEINALSISQMKLCNTASIGSQNWSQATIRELKGRITNYDRVFLWLDELEQAEKLKEILESDRIKIIQPSKDANEYLREGELFNFLEFNFDQIELV